MGTATCPKCKENYQQRKELLNEERNTRRRDSLKQFLPSYPHGHISKFLEALSGNVPVVGDGMIMIIQA